MWSKLRGWHADLSRGAKVVLWTGALIFAMLLGNSLGNNNGNTQKVATKSSPSGQAQQSNKSEPKPKPAITTKTETEDTTIAYQSQTQDDTSLDKGTTVTAIKGADGIKTTTYKVTFTDGKETGREQVSEEVTKEPVTEVIHVGTKVAVQTPAPTPKPASNCDPNYSGACVPIASDVDCAGGSGNGPAYVAGPVRVIGTDIYGLDRDGNGIGCE